MRDEQFIRGAIPMTKSEVRAVSLSKLEIQKDSVIYDVGAGTGSVTVEAAMAAECGHVYAFEQKEEGCELIRANCKAFGVHNVTVIPGKAPDSMRDCPAPDLVFVGGSGGSLESILDLVQRKNPSVRMVINVIALETLARVMAYFQERDMEPEVVCVQVSRGEMKGRYHLMQGQNPVYILTAEGKSGRSAEGKSDRMAEGKSGRMAECRVHIPRIMIAAPESGCGKTMITAGLLTCFQRRGLRCSSFKCGPDYIDPMFHRYVLGIGGCNLDSFFLPEDEVRCLFERRVAESELAVIEGVMGYYDGVAGNTLQASAYDISRITRTPVILVLDGKSSSLSLAAQVRGFLTYQKDSRIVGVILNRTSPGSIQRLRTKFEELGVVCLGTVPVCEEGRLESRHLGLTIPAEQDRLRERLEQLADQLEQSLDVDRILALARSAEDLEKAGKQEASVDAHVRPVRRMGLARDEAFCFYYQENLEFLEREGWELVEFSPIHDSHLPEHLDGLLLGGGYPEVYARQLSENRTMLEDIRNAASSGVRILAECGGFLYLHRTLEGLDGKIYEMAGIIEADGFRTERLSRFGYISLGAVNGHEFHYWDSTDPGAAMTAQKPASDRSWNCMHRTETMLAGFPHLYYLSAPEWIREFLRGTGKERT